jgi:hypothetical protein
VEFLAAWRWPTTVEGWVTVFAGLIVIGTFVAGVTPKGRAVFARMASLLSGLRVFLPRPPERNILTALLRREPKVIRITPAVDEGPAEQVFLSGGTKIVMQRPPTAQPRLVAPKDATPVRVQHRGVAWSASRDVAEDFEVDGPFCPTHETRLLFRGFGRAARSAQANDRIGKLSVMRCPTDDASFPLVSPHEEMTLLDIRGELRHRLRALDEDKV